MNILIPHHWLLHHLDTKATPKQIQQYLSLCGPSVERIDKVHGEEVYDIEVTTNRIDSMSVRGIAREAAAILPEFDIPSSLKPLHLADIGKNSLPKIDLLIDNDPKLCQRILAITLSVKKVGDSPKWLQKRLHQVGQRPLNNLIDITNFVMWELGHPIHVFDYDRLYNKKIIVRQAKEGEKLTTLDNQTHTTRGGEVVFDDGTGVIIDLPGIMGTKNSVVSSKTKNILLWVEDVPANLIRQASMGLAIRTQAAVLNEKNVDPEIGLPAIQRAVDLVQQLNKGQLTSSLTDIYPHQTKIHPSTLTQSTLDTYLGLKVHPKRVTRILTNLGCEVGPTKDTKIGQTNYIITPPTYRANDLVIEQDYVEEIARIYGYHNLPSNLMTTPIPEVDTNFNHQLEHFIKQTLTGWGATEVYTYSLISETLAKSTKHSIKDHLAIKNPLSDDMAYLRKSLLASHQQVFNANKTATDLLIFEMANTYHTHHRAGTASMNANTPIFEMLELVISSHSSKFSQLKGILDGLATKLRLRNYHIKPDFDPSHFPEFNPSLSGEIYTNNTSLGCVGRNILGFYSCLIDVSALIAGSSTHPTYTPIPSTSPIIEDLTFSLPPKTHLGPLIDTGTSIDTKITSITLKDVFNHNHTFTVSYQHPTNQLTAKDVKPIRTKLINTLRKKFSARLVGTV